MTFQDTITGNLAIMEDFLKSNDVVIDYAETSLEWLEQYIFDRREGWSAEQAESIIVLVGCYLGECMRRSYGGEWVQTEHDTVVMVEGISARPFRSVERVVAGEPHKSIVSFHRVFPAILKQSRLQNAQKDDEDERKTK